jgi:SAM-dependent methyltransferase
LRDFEALADSGLLGDPRIVGTELALGVEAPDGLLPGAVAAVLRHERVPFVSYPYEWSFSMLKDAAMLQLDLMLDALECGLVLKDATPYNVQFVGSRPVFIDVGAFERLREKELWAGYRQFCALYLYPLLLQALTGIAFQPWLRGSLEGIGAGQVRAALSFRDRFRRGVWTNVHLFARLERRDSDARGARSAVAGAERQIIAANVRKLRRLINRLHWEPPAGVWVDYGVGGAYDERDAARKAAFVAAVVRASRWERIWDLGANTGTYSLIAARGAGHVVAIDADAGAIELLYRRLRAAGDETILPLTMDIADPSPSLGWRGRERRSLPERGRPDLVLVLALVHHLAIGASVPLREIVDWFAELGGTLVIEFPTREDAMVRKLLARKRSGLHADYDREHFERCLAGAFDVRRSEELAGGTRVLYHATPRR